MFFVRDIEYFSNLLSAELCCTFSRVSRVQGIKLTTFILLEEEAIKTIDFLKMLATGIFQFGPLYISTE